MLPQIGAAPFHRSGWVYEEKYDGYRILAHKERRHVRLMSRNGRDWAGRFAEIAKGVASLPGRSLVLDGEVAAFDETLVSRFELLHNDGAARIYCVFDCLWHNGRDLRWEPFEERRGVLEQVADGSELLFPARRMPADGMEPLPWPFRGGMRGSSPRTRPLRIGLAAQSDGPRSSAEKKPSS
jgi:bifunctional non-homologous end joining protein LigD